LRLVRLLPDYSLGNIYAAQLWQKAGSDLCDMEQDFARGDFASLREWLRDNVHRHGSRYPASQLIERVTGRPPDPGPMIAYLRDRYEPMYRCRLQDPCGHPASQEEAACKGSSVRLSRHIRRPEDHRAHVIATLRRLKW